MTSSPQPLSTKPADERASTHPKGLDLPEIPDAGGSTGDDGQRTAIEQQ